MNHSKHIPHVHAVLIVLFLGMVSCNQTKDSGKAESIESFNEQVSLYENGAFIFQDNCGMCHKIEKQSAGIAFNSFPKTWNTDQLFKILDEGKQHPKIKITLKETEALIEFINKK